MPLINLTTNIHACFQESKFSGPGVHYDSIRPALQLATQLLGRSLPFFHSILEGAPQLGTQTRGNKTSSPTDPVWQLPLPPQRLTDQEAFVAMTHLDSLAGGLSYTVEKKDTAAGCTYPVSTHTFTGGIWTGCGSKIHISQDISHAMYLSYCQGHDNEGSLGLILNYAVMLVHELSHAALNARFAKADQGAYYVGDALSTELGRSLEVYLFGASIGMYGHQESMTATGESIPIKFAMQDWPNLSGKLEYSSGADNEVQNEFRGCALPVIDIQWEISLAYLIPLFQDSTWAGLPFSMRADFLRAERNSGIRTICTGAGQQSFYNQPDNFGVPVGHLPAPAGEPQFEFTQTRARINAKVLINGQVLGEVQGLKRKKDAKEQVCQAALGQLEPQFGIPGKARRKDEPSTGEHTRLFRDACHLRRLTAKFRYKYTYKGHSVKVLVSGEIPSVARNYLRKSQAKEQACKSAIDMLEAFGEPQDQDRVSTYEQSAPETPTTHTIVESGLGIAREHEQNGKSAINTVLETGSGTARRCKLDGISTANESAPSTPAIKTAVVLGSGTAKGHDQDDAMAEAKSSFRAGTTAVVNRAATRGTMDEVIPVYGLLEYDTSSDEYRTELYNAAVRCNGADASAPIMSSYKNALERIAAARSKMSFSVARRANAQEKIRDDLWAAYSQVNLLMRMEGIDESLALGIVETMIARGLMIGQRVGWCLCLAAVCRSAVAGARGDRVHRPAGNRDSHIQMTDSASTAPGLRGTKIRDPFRVPNNDVGEGRSRSEIKATGRVRKRASSPPTHAKRRKVSAEDPMSADRDGINAVKHESVTPSGSPVGESVTPSRTPVHESTGEDMTSVFLEILERYPPGP